MAEDAGNFILRAADTASGTVSGPLLGLRRDLNFRPSLSFSLDGSFPLLLDLALGIVFFGLAPRCRSQTPLAFSSSMHFLLGLALRFMLGSDASSFVLGVPMRFGGETCPIFNSALRFLCVGMSARLGSHTCLVCSSPLRFVLDPLLRFLLGCELRFGGETCLVCDS